MRAAVLHSPNSALVIEDVDLAAPRAGEVRVRMAATGVCHSDWHLVTGDTRHPLPVVLGHEGAGTVEEVGPGVDHVRPGDAVALSWAPSCGTCFYCDRGSPNLCATYVEPIWKGTMLDGTPRLSLRGEPVFHYCALAGFAEAAVLPAVCCVKIPRELPWPVAAVLGCAVTTGVGSVLNTARVEGGSHVAVFGVGGVGLSTVMGARLAGAETIIAVDPSAERREAALDLGATHALVPGSHLITQIHDLTAGRGVDYAFEAVGIPSVQEECLEAVRPGGTVVFSGLSPMGSKTNLPGALLVREEKTVKGSYYGSANPPEDFLRYADFYLQGRLPLDRLITRTYPLEEVNQAFADMLAGLTRRGVIEF